MGFIAVIYMSMAILTAVVAFRGAKAAWRMPAVLNVPGAFFVFAATISLAGWITPDLFDGYTHIPAPDAPWCSWLTYMGLAIFWYGSIAFLLTKVREKDEASVEAE